MNEQPTTQFLDEYTIAMQVQMRAEDNEGWPTLKVMVVPRNTEPSKVLAASRPLMEIYFGHEESSKSHMTFFNPDGSVFFNAKADDDPVLDSELEGPLNESWAGSRDSKFMPAVRATVQHTVAVMLAASGMSTVTQESPEHLFRSLMKQVTDEGVARLLDTREVEGEVQS